MFKLGARKEASAAFKLASRLGPPKFTTQRPMYRLLARSIGFEMAEHVALAYRNVIPAQIRAGLNDPIEK